MIPDDIKDDDKKNNQQVVGAGGGVGPATGGLSVPEQGNFSTTTPQQTNVVQKEATIQDHLNANKSQGAELGKQFQSNLSGKLNTDKNMVSSAADQAKNQITSNVVNYDPNLIQTAVNEPTKITGDPNQLNSFLKQWNAAYSGPSSFETSSSYDQASKAAQDATQKGEQLKTTGGREQTLQDEFKVYGQGNKGLDQALLQNYEGYGDIQKMAPAFTDVGTYLTQKSKELGDAATQAQTTTNATKTNTRNALANKLTDFQSDLKKRVSDLQTDKGTLSNQITSDLASGDIGKIKGDLANFNLTDEQKSTIQDYLGSLNKDYGISPDLSQAYTFNPATDINTANAATPEDYANAAAWQQLTGVDYGGVLSPNDAAKAGTWNTLGNSLKAGDIGTALRKAEWEAAVNKIVNPNAAPTNTGSSSQPQKKSLQDYLKQAAPFVAPGVSLGVKAGEALMNGVNKVGDAFSDALGIGGGKGDAVVNLPAFTANNLPIPSKADSASMKAIAEIVSKPLSMAGSYHEDSVNDAANRIDLLGMYKRNGQITDDEYKAYSQPFIDWTKNAIATISGAGSKAADSVKNNTNRFNEVINPTKPRPLYKAM